MKQILIAYGLVSLIAIAVLSVLSYGHGAGYVYVFWHDWQLQTNLWIVFIALALLSFSLHLVWLGLKRYLSREKRKAETVFDFKDRTKGILLLIAIIILLQKVVQMLSD